MSFKIKKEKIIRKGAEANLYYGNWFGKEVIFKYRKPKKYRIEELDKKTLDSTVLILKSLKTRFEGMTSRLDRESSVWNNVSNIYPVLKSLEKDGLINVLEEKTIQGRNRKIYGLTEVGEDHLRESLFAIFGFLTFIIPSKGEKLDTKIFSPLKMSLKEQIPLEDNIDLSIDHFKEIMESTGIPIFFEPWLLFMSLIIIRNPQFIKTMISKSQTVTEKMIRKTILYTQLRNVQEAVSSALEIMDQSSFQPT